jgi:hypothetical protein
MYKFTDSNFTPKQKRNYKILRFMFNWAGWLVIACVVLPVLYELLAYFVKGVAYVDISIDIPVFGVIVTGVILWFLLRWFVANRCINCFKSNALEEQSETIVSDWSKYGVEMTKIDKGGLQVMAVKQLKCKKCGFECQQITTRTGSTDGIGRMSRDIKQGGRSRLKGESYTSWWRRNK